ncbi:HAMP domain-containing sensor histidine kinase [Sporolituus thermophilus]|uniref:histidine kinase n=1 Tax=Sporolituus thermophilus DSM 23256 TaxID=1123285 RepID=A0A1G7M6F9_9FIRM|nr:HAMP domain-containing protein [Sporolituus thermophilus]SDF56790.1 Histidine kinase-, DNA gyrase B-, and HSP90-like ATPase [Sporolituus thermophilus DSM 23256]
MRWLGRLSIYYKVNGIIVGMLLLVGLLVWIVIRQATVDLLGQQMEKRGLEVANYIAALSANDILLDNHYALYERISKTQHNTEDVRYVLITDYTGRILAHTFSDGLPRGLATLRDSGGSLAVIKFDTNEGTIREVMVPIENGDIGFVRVGMSENSTQQLLNKTNRNFFIGIIMMCVIATFLATWLTSVIIRPIRSLAEAVAKIQSGNLSARVEAKTGDEVGLLAVAFNQMVAGLKEKEKENNLLLEELRHKEAMRTFLIKKLFTIQEDERKRISRELHDETGQLLASLLAYMKLLLSKLTDQQQKELLQEARDVAVNALEGLRKIAVELRPPVLDDLGVTAAMQKYIQTFSRQQGLKVHFSAPEEQLELDPEISLALYRILQESLTNIAKHARASNVYVCLSAADQTVRLIVRDDGLGINGSLESAGPKNRLGIYGMKERAELLGGSLDIHSENGCGTVVIVVLPKILSNVLK